MKSNQYHHTRICFFMRILQKKNLVNSRIYYSLPKLKCFLVGNIALTTRWNISRETYMLATHCMTLSYVSSVCLWNISERCHSLDYKYGTQSILCEESIVYKESDVRFQLLWIVIVLWIFWGPATPCIYIINITKLFLSKIHGNDPSHPFISFTTELRLIKNKQQFSVVNVIFLYNVSSSLKFNF